jgi:hypothetical protein
VVAQPGHTCRRSDWLLTRPDFSIIWTREPVDNHTALIALLNTTRDFPRMHDSGGRRRVNTLQTAGRADLLPSLPSQPRDLKQKARLRKDPGLCFVLTIPRSCPTHPRPRRQFRHRDGCPSIARSGTSGRDKIEHEGRHTTELACTCTAPPSISSSTISVSYWC